MTRGFMFLICIALMLSCSNHKVQTDVLYQVNSFDILMQGNYDGNWLSDDVLENGDFGIGSFDRLNGEMVLVDGQMFRIHASGEAQQTDTGESACIATLCWFMEDFEFEVQNLSIEELKQKIKTQLPDTTLFYAIRIEGEFEAITTRSIYPQEKPYRPLPEVLAEEVRRESADVTGTGVGFLAPSHVQGAVWKGFHFHFLSDDHSFGGHIINFVIRNAVVKIDILNQLNLIL